MNQSVKAAPTKLSPSPSAAASGLAAWLQAAATKPEAWKYTSLQHLAALSPAPAPANANLSVPTLPTTDGPQLVFINGHWRPEQSNLAGLPREFLRADASGYHLSLDAATCLALAPLRLVFLTSHAAGPTCSTLNLSIALGASARLTLISEHHSASAPGTAPHLSLVQKNISLGPHAKLVHVVQQQLALADTYLANHQIQLAAGAFYQQFALQAGASLARQEIEASLNGAAAQLQLDGIQLVRGTQHCDTMSVITHAVAGTSSREVYKTIADDKAKGIFSGKIIVAKDAQQTDGYQLSRGLLLSPQAEINARPELEIFANDVKCSHGSTVGMLDEQALFYLQSRGISRAAATALLLEAFVADLLPNLPSEALQTTIAAQLQAWFKAGETS